MTAKIQDGSYKKYSKTYLSKILDHDSSLKMLLQNDGFIEIVNKIEHEQKMNVKYNLNRSVAKQLAKKESLWEKLGFNCERCGSQDVVEPKGYKSFGSI